MSKIRIGIIGTGNISNNHLRAYKSNPDVEIYALCDINKELLEKVGREYGITRLYTDKDEMLKLAELDAVSVCTWNSAHAECVLAALNAGKHVLCEKPMSITVEEARIMKETADKNGKLLMIGFVRRFGNDMNILKDFINNGTLGEIYYAKATYLRRNGNPGGWFGDKSRSGGGPLIDLGVHIIDFVRYALGNPKPISVYGATYQKLLDRRNIKSKKSYVSAGASDNDVCDVEDLACAMIRFDNGATLSIETSFSLNKKNDEGKIELFGTKGGVCINPDLEIYTEMNDYLVDVNLRAPTSMGSMEDIFAKEIGHFVECVKGNCECKNPAQDGIELMKILNAIYESARSGHEVIL